LTAAIALTPNSPEMYLLRAQVYLRTEDPSSAVPDLEQVLGLTDDEDIIIAAKQFLSLLR
ncbi:MAG: hypothetical protein J4N99_08200, partial [Chloroflexi bacterium]|nr:hypothetical protein [Chloroflexota bacterium]